jgi:hypothetical protein
VELTQPHLEDLDPGFGRIVLLEIQAGACGLTGHASHALLVVQLQVLDHGCEPPVHIGYDWRNTLQVEHLHN